MFDDIREKFDGLGVKTHSIFFYISCFLVVSELLKFFEFFNSVRFFDELFCRFFYTLNSKPKTVKHLIFKILKNCVFLLKAETHR